MHVHMYVCTYVRALEPASHFSRQFQAHMKGGHCDTENRHLPCRYQFSCAVHDVRHLGWSEHTLTDKWEHNITLDV